MISLIMLHRSLNNKQKMPIPVKESHRRAKKFVDLYRLSMKNHDAIEAEANLELDILNAKALYEEIMLFDKEEFSRFIQNLNALFDAQWNSTHFHRGWFFIPQKILNEQRSILRTGKQLVLKLEQLKIDYTKNLTDFETFQSQCHDAFKNAHGELASKKLIDGFFDELNDLESQIDEMEDLPLPPHLALTTSACTF